MIRCLFFSTDIFAVIILFFTIEPILNESIKHNDPSQRPVERTNLYIGVESDIENSFIGRYNDGRDLNTFLFTLALLGECMGTDIVLVL